MHTAKHLLSPLMGDVPLPKGKIYFEIRVTTDDPQYYAQPTNVTVGFATDPLFATRYWRDSKVGRGDAADGDWDFVDWRQADLYEGYPTAPVSDTALGALVATYADVNYASNPTGVGGERTSGGSSDLNLIEWGDVFKVAFDPATGHYWSGSNENWFLNYSPPIQESWQVQKTFQGWDGALHAAQDVYLVVAVHGAPTNDVISLDVEVFGDPANPTNYPVPEGYNEGI